MRSRIVRRRGFTLVELLVVIAIIGVLVALLLPAVQAAREAARRAQCQDHLKNLSLGCIMHHDTHQIMPSGGWGWMWVGDPDGGAGESQPGNWLFSVLPFIEQPALYALGRDGSATNYASTAQMEGAAQRELAPLPIINCPSRRPAVTYSRHSSYPSKTLNANVTDRAVRTDYGGNVGNIAKGTSWAATSFPRTLAAVATYVWPRQTDGVIIQRGEINLRRIEDGTTKTYLVGERYLNPLAHDSGDDLADNESAYAGMDNDSLQGTCELPLADTPGIPHDGFGSSHPGVWHMAYCDGSVHAMSYDVEPAIHAQLGSRDGGDCGYNGSGL